MPTADATASMGWQHPRATPKSIQFDERTHDKGTWRRKPNSFQGRRRLYSVLSIMTDRFSFFLLWRRLALVGFVVIGVSGCAGDEKSAPDFGETIGAHERSVFAVAFSPGGETVYSTDGGNLIRAWDVGSALPVFGGSTIRGVKTLAFSPSGKVAVARYGNVLTVLDVVNVRRLNSFKVGLLDIFTFFPKYAYLSSDGAKALLVDFGGNVSLWDLVEGRALHPLLTTVGAHDARNASAFSPAGTVILIASSNRSALEIRDVESGNILRTLFVHKQGTRASAFSVDGTEIATVGMDNSFKRWHVESGKLLASYDTSDIAGINRVAFSSYRQLIITGHNDGSMIIWSVNTGTILKRFRAHDGWVETIAVSPDGKALASGGPLGKVKYWNLTAILAD